MIFRFDAFELDVDRAELRAAGQNVRLEPKVFDLLKLLLENADRVVSKDEIIEVIWEGRFISDSALATAIKTLRQALGDDGKTQKFIRTLHGRGFRFVADAQTEKPIRAGVAAHASADAPDHPALQSGRPSIAVVPFRTLGNNPRYSAISEAIPAEIIASLSCLRWLRVVARGSTFQFRDAEFDLETIHRKLNVRYCLSGLAELDDRSLGLSVELWDAASQDVIWAERFSGQIDDVHALRERIVESVVAALDLRIPLQEAANARLKAPENLDAWDQYHLGLTRLFRFDAADLVVAKDHFERAVEMENGFARARAGLSFVHFYNAFQMFSDDHDREQALARKWAEDAMSLDPIDPFINAALARSEWLEGKFQSSHSWLDRSIELCPNYAHAHYTQAMLSAALCNGADGERSGALAMDLSPLDKTDASMSATRALNCFVIGNRTDAARWADRAVHGAARHAFIYAAAALAYSDADDLTAARQSVEKIREFNPGFRQDDFLKRFNFVEPEIMANARNLLTKSGLA